jgi:arginine N-succinyltransferase
MRSDRDDLLELAGHLDSVNLPNDPDAIEPIIATSEASFSGEIGDPRRRQYLFVLYDRQERQAVGTSMIVAQLGRRDAPYTYFDVRRDERYSTTLDRHFVHTVLDIGYSYNGPTEIGGLVMHPGYRRSPGKLGMQISYVRFLWMAMHPAHFQETILAELLPPLEPDGTSHLWEAVGRQFTGLSYRAADRMTSKNKEFIRSLFPDGEIYASLLPEAAQSVIGQVGPQTKGVEKLLRRIGFRYAHRVDPFDGGPHFTAQREDISLLQRSRPAHLEATPRLSAERPPQALIGVEYDRPPWFRAVAVPCELTRRAAGPAAPAHAEAGANTAAARIPREALERLGSGERCWVLPLD